MEHNMAAWRYEVSFLAFLYTCCFIGQLSAVPALLSAWLFLSILTICPIQLRLLFRISPLVIITLVISDIVSFLARFSLHILTVFLTEVHLFQSYIVILFLFCYFGCCAFLRVFAVVQWLLSPLACNVTEEAIT